jgi:hypothetical protein
MYESVVRVLALTKVTTTNLKKKKICARFFSLENRLTRNVDLILDR